MGLTIHYTLRSEGGSAAEIRSLIGKLQARATALPFQHVTPVIEFKEELPDDWQETLDPLAGWLGLQSEYALQLGDEHWDMVPPAHAIGFVVCVGEGSEPAAFALCRYPESFQSKGRAVPTFLDGWCWRGFCKTQYASNPECGGTKNFIRCHTSIVALLDVAAELGILGEVSDEGDYWEGRSIEQLTERVNRYNRLVAGFVGAMRDAVEDVGGDPGALQSEITKYPNFEHLEADQRIKKEDEQP